MATEAAVVLYLDAETDAHFRKLSAKIAGAIGEDYMMDNQIPLHITVGIFSSEKEIAPEEIFKTYMQNFERRPITFSGLGVFLPSVLYAVPVMDEFLHSCNLEVVRIARAAGMEPLDRYTFGGWTPHLALASGLDENFLMTAFSVAVREFAPVTGFVERVAVTHCCPYEELGVWGTYDGNLPAKENDK